MMTLSMISLLVGAALGQRFKVIVLIPAMPILLILAVGTGVTHAQPAWSIVLVAAAAATCLQMGYLIGIFIHHLFLTALSRRSSLLTSSEASVRRAAR